MDTFRDLLALWPSCAEAARDFGATYNKVASWKHRNSIPPASWPVVITAAAKRGFEGVNSNALMGIAEKVAASQAQPADAD